MEQLALLVLGALIPVAGYVIKRWWEGQSTRDKIQDALNLANLHQKLGEGNVSVEALEGLKSELIGRAKVREENELEVLSNIESKITPQNDMNRYAFYL